MMVNLIDFRMGMQDTIESLRLHCERGPVFVDSRMSALRAMGHNIVPVQEHVNSVNFARPVGALIDPITEKRHGGADPMRSTGIAGL